MRTGDRIETSSVMMIAEIVGLKLHVSHSSAELLSNILRMRGGCDSTCIYNQDGLLRGHGDDLRHMVN